MMHFGQKVHPLNFAYAERAAVATDDRAAVEFTAAAGAAVRVSGSRTRALGRPAHGVERSRLPTARQYSDGVAPAWRDAGRDVAPTAAGVFETAGFTVTATAAGLDLRWATGGHLPPTTSAVTDRAWHVPGPAEPGPRSLLGGVGVNGPQTTLQWELGGATAALGFGERTGRLNRLGQSMDHHTVDVVAVHAHHWQRDDFDPAYVAIPLAILRLADGAYVGLFFDNPQRTVLDVGKRLPGVLMFQAMDGPTDLYLLAGPTLRDVARHFAELTGRAELPPPWALGHHQCRWGYQREADFRALAARFREFDIPTSVFWYDIDYMDAYRVFTWNGRTPFPTPGGSTTTSGRTVSTSSPSWTPG